jgi:hypothetical protein
MKKGLWLVIPVCVFIPLLNGQYTFFTPKGSFTVEVALDNSPYLRLPIYQNAITSLEVVGDYAIGGTSAEPGLSPYVFAVSLSKRRLVSVFPLEKVLPGQRKIQSGFGKSNGRVLYAGTMPDRAGDTGHIIAVAVRGSNGQIDVTDLGTPISGEGIFALTCDPACKALYGISHPNGKFFVFHIPEGRTEVFDLVSSDRRTRGILREYALTPDDVLARRLIVDRAGRVYGSHPVNKIFRYDPTTRRIEVLPDELPEVWGRRALGRVDSWALAPDGTIYGGNAGDGQLFKINPDTGRVVNLGKPAMMPRMKGLAFAYNGVLYGVTGGAPGYSHLFSYSSSGRGFVDLGNPRFIMSEPGIEQGIPWRGFQIATLAASEDGRYIVMGEEEALSQLMVFPVE